LREKEVIFTELFFHWGENKHLDVREEKVFFYLRLKATGLGMERVI
jgi:hypothetical protein